MKKFSWGYGIAAAYILFALSMIAFVWVASQQKYDLVSETYYDDAVNYQEKIDATAGAMEPGKNIAVEYLQEDNKLK
jgi:hypothetical protein